MCFSPKGSEHARADQRFCSVLFIFFLKLDSLISVLSCRCLVLLMNVRGRLENVLIRAKGREGVGNRRVLVNSWGSIRNLESGNITGNLDLKSSPSVGMVMNCACSVSAGEQQLHAVSSSPWDASFVKCE